MKNNRIEKDNTLEQVTINIPQHNKTIAIQKGRNLFRVLREHDINIAQSCEGDGICGTCFVNITPKKNCTPPSKREISLKRANQLQFDVRFSCLIRIQGNISISTPYW